MDKQKDVTLKALQAQLAALQTVSEAWRVENADLRVALQAAQQRVTELEGENQRLSEELKALKQAPFQPRRRRKSQRQGSATRQSGGRKAGHPGSGRQRPSQVDRTEFIGVGEYCPDCGWPLSGGGVQRERIVEDIEPVRPVQVTRYEIERRWCPHCHIYKEAQVVAALPRHRLGLYVMLFVVYQKVALGLSYGKIQREPSTYFGLRISKGQLSNLVAKVADLFGPTYRRLIELLRQQAAVHIDETGWRVKGDKLIEGKPPPDPERLEFKENLHHLFLEMGLALEQATRDAAARQRLYQEMRERLQAFAQRAWRDADCCWLAARIHKYLDDLLLWLRVPEGAAANNAAERALRPAVAARKTSFGSRSKKGGLDFARLLSLIRTWEQQEQDFFSTAHALLSQACS